MPILEGARVLSEPNWTSNIRTFQPKSGRPSMSTTQETLWHTDEQVQSLAEEILITRAQAGDRLAFGELVRRYQGAVFNLCYRMLGDYHEAEDAAQDVFLKVYRGLKQYNAAYRFSTWVLSIASHACIDRLRKRRVTLVPLETATVSDRVSRSPAPDELLIQDEERDQVQRLLNQLPEDHRLILVLHYWYDWSYPEIAQLLGTTAGAVKTKAHRARRRLGALLLEGQS